MAGDIKKYQYKNQEISVKGLCKDGTCIHTYYSPYGFQRLICEVDKPNHPGFETVFDNRGGINLHDPLPVCLPCLLQLIEAGFNRTMIRHESRYNARKGARKKLQYVRLL